ncbi:MAG: transglycosylase SLT domain-containing protein [Chitinophagales bacterium]
MKKKLIKIWEQKKKAKLIKFNSDKELILDVRLLSFLFLFFLASNSFVYYLIGTQQNGFFNGRSTGNLYLLEEASHYVKDINNFEYKVRRIAKKLRVPPEWLMAVMYSESRLNPNAVNLKGSGATGLIQFMPNTIGDFGITIKQLKKLTPTEQLDYVYEYLHRVRIKYRPYENITDLYLAILYPRALTGDSSFVLYQKPSKMYRQNAGLDENKDGKVSVKDVEKRLKRLFPEAFHIDKYGKQLKIQKIMACF